MLPFNLCLGRRMHTLSAPQGHLLSSAFPYSIGEPPLGGKVYDVRNWRASGTETRTPGPIVLARAIRRNICPLAPLGRLA